MSFRNPKSAIRTPKSSFRIPHSVLHTHKSAILNSPSSFHIPHSAFCTSSSAFTLIELMAVMAIIITLMGIIVGATAYINRNALESRAKAEIKALETALEAYKADWGGYPPLDPSAFNNDPLSTEGTLNVTNFHINTSYRADTNRACWFNSQFIYRALCSSNSPKQYLILKSSQLLPNQVFGGATPSSGEPATLIIDPFGMPYGYNPQSPVANPQSFDLFSAGFDSRCSYPTNLSQNVDDIGNWQR